VFVFILLVTWIKGTFALHILEARSLPHGGKEVEGWVVCKEVQAGQRGTGGQSRLKRQYQIKEVW